MAPHFEKLLALFSDEKVEVVVIGGVAMNAQGSANVTFDLDLCYPAHQGKYCSNV